jgi:hypothetical protein
VKLIAVFVVSLVLAFTRNLCLLFVVPLAVLSWTILVLPLLVARSISHRDLRLSLAYFVRFGIQFQDAVLSRSIARPLMGDAREPWPWVEPPVGINATKFRYLL